MGLSFTAFTVNVNVSLSVPPSLSVTVNVISAVPFCSACTSKVNVPDVPEVVPSNEIETEQEVDDSDVGRLLARAWFDSDLLADLRAWPRWEEMKELPLADALKEIGWHHLAKQTEALIGEGIEGVHLYALNRLETIRRFSELIQPSLSFKETYPENPTRPSLAEKTEMPLTT